MTNSTVSTDPISLESQVTDDDQVSKFVHIYTEINNAWISSYKIYNISSCSDKSSPVLLKYWKFHLIMIYRFAVFYTCVWKLLKQGDNLPIVWLWFFVLIIPPEPSCCFESLVFSVSRKTAWSKQSEAARAKSSWTCFPTKKKYRNKKL